MHPLFFSLALVSSVCASPLSTYPHSPPPRTALTKAPILPIFHPHGSVNNSYIIQLKPSTPPSVRENHFNFVQLAHAQAAQDDPLHALIDSGIRHVYDHIGGYAGRFSDHVLDQIRSLPEVEYVELDQVVKTLDVNTQKSAPWGLARVSHRPKLTFSTFTKYEYDPAGGAGVDVYVIDTGINIKHVEFQGRASWGKTIPLNDIDIDGNGHGTHCAGTIASRKYGVAKQAHVIAVKVLGTNGSGTMSDVIAGVQWAVQAARAKAAQAGPAHKGSVANMSLGGGKSVSLDRAVDAAVDAGMHFAVAAGNDDQDACKYSPAASQNAVTVGASTLGDERAYFSNHGKCVDVFAPGLNILSTYIGSDTATSTLSGTSMASPHTAGLIAYLLSLYPSERFDPRVPSYPVLTPPSDQGLTSVGGVYAFVRGVMPLWVRVYLPEWDVEMAPVPVKRMSPEEMKVALVALASEGVLKGPLPAGTKNLLVFNNATA